MAMTVVITGCSSGFGKLLALQLARRPCLRDAARDAGQEGPVAAELSSLAAKEGIDLRVLELDVTSTASVDAAAATVLAESGASDVVNNNAGVLAAFGPAGLATRTPGSD